MNVKGSFMLNFTQKILIFRPPGIFWNENFDALHCMRDACKSAKISDSDFLDHTWPGLGTTFLSVWYVSFFSLLFKERSVLFRSFLEFLATYETQKNAKNARFFLQRT